MDLLFSKYASPFLFLDTMLDAGRFFESVIEIIQADNEKTLWEFYLHKVHDKSFDDFKKSLEADKPVPKEQVETTVINSKSILDNFIPNGG